MISDHHYHEHVVVVVVVVVVVADDGDEDDVGCLCYWPMDLCLNKRKVWPTSPRETENFARLYNQNSCYLVHSLRTDNRSLREPQFRPLSLQVESPSLML